ncbi:Aste57867_3773 [Aphanomyces stellatus]|uniref:Aste57867_3773 protein n=1 Tax=Aphanomyces stellatus TaxID=120398 RepID=A0A485KES2_9STRA|nr:hypothetical protein As57867_003762 [Aphanomyces stellatus]VFT80924.1 Aste57867_3773 [Aphanomyces stellatus]
MMEEACCRRGGLLVVGIATIDVINTIPAYPSEDSKIRVTESRKCRGGNGTNTLVVASQIGAFEALHWMGTLVDPATNSDAKFIADELVHGYGIDLSRCEIVPSGAMPTSYIMASQATGTRTIFHHRDLPDLSVDHFNMHAANSLGDEMAWIHFECREAATLASMLQRAREASSAILSVEVEAPRHRWDLVQPALEAVDFAFVGQSFVESLGFHDATSFLRALASDPRLSNGHASPVTSTLRGVICPWGAKGAFVLDDALSITHVPVASIDHVVDSVGAGDSFIAATISALHVGRLSLVEAVDVGCRVARLKCLQLGFHFDDADIIDDIRQWVSAGSSSKHATAENETCPTSSTKRNPSGR